MHLKSTDIVFSPIIQFPFSCLCPTIANQHSHKQFPIKNPLLTKQWCNTPRLRKIIHHHFAVPFLITKPQRKKTIKQANLDFFCMAHNSSLMMIPNQSYSLSLLTAHRYTFNIQTKIHKNKTKYSFPQVRKKMSMSTTYDFWDMAQVNGKIQVQNRDTCKHTQTRGTQATKQKNVFIHKLATSITLFVKKQWEISFTLSSHSPNTIKAEQQPQTKKISNATNSAKTIFFCEQHNNNNSKILCNA